MAYYYYILGITSIHVDNDYGGITYLHYIIFTSLSCIAIVILQVISKKVRKGEETPEKQALTSSINGSLAIFIGQLLVYPAYLFCIKAYFIHFQHQKEFISAFNKNFESISYFFALTWGYPLELLLVTVGLIFMIIHREKLSDLSLLIISIITGFIFTKISSPVDPRYFLTMYGLMAVIGGYWTGYLKKFSWIAVSVISIIPIMVFSNYFLGIPNLPIIDRSPPLAEEISAMTILKPFPWAIIKPDNSDYHLKEIIDCITDDYKK